MARITVEDCVDKIPNRFDLVLLAAHRARMLSKGSAITVEQDNDKPPVIALREIAEQTISPGARLMNRRRSRRRCSRISCAPCLGGMILLSTRSWTR